MTKEIKRKQIERTVKKEYKEARSFCKGYFGRYYRMMIDADNGKIWSDVFLDSGSYKVYHSDTVHRIDPESIYYAQTIAESEEKYVTEAIRLLKDAGWTIIE